MSHARTQIRQALKAALTGLSTTGNRVYTNRTMAIAAEKLPALNIVIESEAVTFDDIHEDSEQTRELTVSVIALASADDAVDDVLDQMILEVETAIQSGDNNTLSGLVKGVDLTEIDTSLGDEQASTHGQAIMNFNVIYITQASAPDTTL